MLSLNSVASVRATNEHGVFILRCNITDLNGETYDCDYASRPEDQFGLNPAVRRWLDINEGGYSIIPYVPPPPPTADELRSRMSALSRRQLLLALASIGVTEDTVSAVITDPLDMIEWKHATTFERLHPVLVGAAISLSLPPEQVDALWLWASGL